MYVEANKLEDNLGLLTQRGVNDYKQYLQQEASKVEVGKKGGGIESINQKCQFVALMINEVLSCHNEFLDYNIQPVKYTPIEDKRKKDDGLHFLLTIDEREALNNCTGLNERQTVYKDLFILQCNCGQRVSDLKQLVLGNYIKDKENFIHLDTQKEDIKAYFPETETVRQFICKLQSLVYEKNGSHFIKTGDSDINIDNLDKGSLYNNALKQIAKKAGLNRIHKYKDAQGRQLESPICDILSSHCARHTFATIMREKGYDADVVCIMLGHADDTMVKEVYAHNDDTLKTAKLKRAMAKVEGEKSSKSALQLLFAYDKLKELERMKDDSIDILTLPLCKECVFIIKSTANLGKAKRQIANVDEEKREQFASKTSYTMVYRQAHCRYRPI